MVIKDFIKKRTEYQYKKYLNIIEPHKTPEEKKEIISILVDKFGSTTKPKANRFVSYTASTIMKRWVKQHFADAKRLGFKLGLKGKPAFSKISNCYFGILQFDLGKPTTKSTKPIVQDIYDEAHYALARESGFFSPRRISR